MMELEIEPVENSRQLYKLKKPIDLRLLRLQAGYSSIMKFAEACDSNYSEIRRIESGELIEIRLSKLMKIKQVLQYGVVENNSRINL